MEINYRSNLMKVLILIVVTASVTAGIYIAYRLSIMLTPFLIAFILSSVIEPLIRAAEKKFRLKRKLAVPIALALIISGFGLLLVLVISRLVTELKSLAYILPGVFSALYTRFVGFTDRVTSMYGWLPPEIAEKITSIFANLSNSLIKMTDQIVKGIFATAVSLPQALAFILTTITAAYFMSSDRYIIIKYLKNQIPQNWINKISTIRNRMFSIMTGYVKAALILMALTFIELFAGFSIIHIRYALLLAFLIAFIDALPVVGTGSILIPWAVINYIIGDFRLGTSIIIMYIIVLIIRQMVEPKIYGRQIGVHPLSTLVAMYAGLQLLGVAGLIFGPAAFLLIKSILSVIYDGRTLKDLIDGGSKRK